MQMRGDNLVKSSERKLRRTIMGRSAVILFIVVVFVAYCNGQQARNCTDPNAVWSSCGSLCEVKCIKPKEPQACPEICIPKCVCKRDYVLGPDGNCISHDECLRRMRCVGPSRVWNNCGSACEPRCIPIPRLLTCHAMCVPKCSCAPGYVIGPESTCITKKVCDDIKRCGQNEIWTECGNNCEPRCNETTSRPICSRICVRKCMCRRGFVRGPNGNCIERRECPC